MTSSNHNRSQAPDRIEAGAGVGFEDGQAGEARSGSDNDLRVVVDADPQRAARRLAHRLGAELVEGSVAAEDLVRHRLSLGVPTDAEVQEAVALTESLGGSEAAQDRALAATVADERPLVRYRPPNQEDLGRLRRLDDGLEMLARVYDRTRALAAQQLAEHLGVPDRSAVPAEEVRSAAARLIEAEAPTEAPALGPQGAAAKGFRPSEAYVAVPSPRRTGAFVVEGLVILLAGLAVAAVLISGVSPAVAVAAVVVALGVAFAVDRHSRRVAAADSRDRHIALETLRQASAPRPPTEKADNPSEEAPVEQARQEWKQIAGDADPRQVDEWLGTHGPSSGLDSAAVETAPSVRAAASALRRARANWRVIWAGLGQDAPEPHSAASAAALEGLAAAVEDGTAVVDVDAPGRLAEAEAALIREQARRRLAHLLGPRSLAELRRAGEVYAEEAPVVLVEPFTDLGPRRAEVLRRQLRELRHADRVVAVVADRSHVPTV